MKRSNLAYSWFPYAKDFSQFVSFQAYSLTPWTDFTLVSIFVKEEQYLDEAEKMLESIKMLHLYYQESSKTNKNCLQSILDSIVTHLEQSHLYEDLPLFILHSTKNGKIVMLQSPKTFNCLHKRKNSISHLQHPSLFQKSLLLWKSTPSLEGKEYPFLRFQCCFKKKDLLFLFHPAYPLLTQRNQWSSLISKPHEKDSPKNHPSSIIGSIKVT